MMEPASSPACAKREGNMKSQAETIAELNARCDGANQFEKFDRGVRASLSVTKEAVLKEKARQKKLRAMRRNRKAS
jgi:hypothetical protein